MIDCWGSADEDVKLGPLKTCRFDTRIDYILSNAMMLNTWVLKQIETVDDNASDHNMVIVHLSRVVNWDINFWINRYLLFAYFYSGSLKLSWYGLILMNMYHRDLDTRHLEPCGRNWEKYTTDEEVQLKWKWDQRNCVSKWDY